MPRNIRGGSGFKKGKKNNDTIVRKFPTKSEFEKKGESTCYAQVISILGGKNVLLNVEGKEILGIICGSMYKKVYMVKNDYVLCSIRTNLKNDKCDIIFKYNNDEVKYLKKTGEIIQQDENNLGNFNENDIEIEIIQQQNISEELNFDDI